MLLFDNIELSLSTFLKCHSSWFYPVKYWLRLGNCEKIIAVLEHAPLSTMVRFIYFVKVIFTSSRSSDSWAKPVDSELMVAHP